jgi:arylsulfatase A-like enzyme
MTLESTLRAALLLGLMACRDAPVQEAVEPEPETPPNFLIIDIDSLRADRLEPPPPAIASLVSRGVHFTHTITPSGWTLPSLTAMLSGQHSPNELMEPLEEPATTRTFPGILSAYGYHTGVAWGHTVLTEHPRSKTWLNPSGEVRDMIGVLGVAKALAEDPPEPFVYLLHDTDLHVPLDTKSKPGPEQARARYDHALQIYDRELQRVLQALDDTGLAERTVVVLLTDHGEELYDHDALGHGRMHWDTIIRTPMVIVDPALPSSQGLVQTRAVSTLDLAPTLLERAGVEVHSEMEGISLLSALRGESLPEREFYTLTRHLTASLRTSRWKLILQALSCGDAERKEHPPLKQSQCELLYDLESDPLEQHNIAWRHPDRVEKMATQLLAWVAEQEVEDVHASPEFIEHLKERGYWENVPVKE